MQNSSLRSLFYKQNIDMHKREIYSCVFIQDVKSQVFKPKTGNHYNVTYRELLQFISFI